MLGNFWNTFIPAMFQKLSQAPLVPYRQGLHGANMDEVALRYFPPQNRLFFVRIGRQHWWHFLAESRLLFCARTLNTGYPNVKIRAILRLIHSFFLISSFTADPKLGLLTRARIEQTRQNKEKVAQAIYIFLDIATGPVCFGALAPAYNASFRAPR